MIDKVVDGGAGDQIAGMQRMAEEDLLFSKAHGSSIFAAGLDNGQVLVVHTRGGKKVGLSFQDGGSLLSGERDVVLLRDRQGIITSRFTMSEPPEGFTPMTGEEMQQVSSGSNGLEFKAGAGEPSWT